MFIAIVFFPAMTARNLDGYLFAVQDIAKSTIIGGVIGSKCTDTDRINHIRQIRGVAKQRAAEHFYLSMGVNADKEHTYFTNVHIGSQISNSIGLAAAGSQSNCGFIPFDVTDHPPNIGFHLLFIATNDIVMNELILLPHPADKFDNVEKRPKDFKPSVVAMDQDEPASTSDSDE